MQRCAGNYHNNDQSNKAKQAVDHGKANFLQRKNIFGNIHLAQQQCVAHNAGHSHSGCFTEKGEQQLTDYQINGIIAACTAAHAAHHGGKYHKHNGTHHQGVQYAPCHTQNTAAILQLKITAD